MNQELIIFGIIVSIILFSVIIWLIMTKKFIHKDNLLTGKLLEIDRSLLGKPFHPVRLFMFTKDFYPDKQISKTMYVVEVINESVLSNRMQRSESIGCELADWTHNTVFYQIDSETFKLFSECGCKEFRLTFKTIHPGNDKLYFEPYSGMR